jgi:hypothetical protein
MIAYNTNWLFNLSVIKEAKRWSKQNLISADQYSAIKESHPSGFYHPNLVIRILLFIATLIALAGVTGLIGLIMLDAIEDYIEVLCIFYGLGSWIFLEMVFVKNSHYKSGVNEALLYHSIGWTIGGVAGTAGFNEEAVIVTCLIVFSFAAIRYADLICTACGFASFAYLVFHELYAAGGIFQQIIPIVFIIVFTPVYFMIIKAKKIKNWDLWGDCLILIEALSLLTIYAAGNYFVVRELSENLMSLYIEPGKDIPFAWLFYALTVIIPITYLYFGITKKNIVLLRVSLVAVAFSVFTFKYYFSLGHPEITLTLAGAILLTLALYLFRFLKTPRFGYTRETLLKEKWADANPEAFIISQTLGGNKVTMESPADLGGGGTTGGGGSSDGW